jgi:hypothetical protein
LGTSVDTRGEAFAANAESHRALVADLAAKLAPPAWVGRRVAGAPCGAGASCCRGTG